MRSNMAAIWGASVGYTESNCSVMIETIDGRICSISKVTFEYLYCKINEFAAALKEDCIEYVMYRTNRPILSYPKWYIDAFRDGLICDDGYGGHVFYDWRDGDIPMSPTSMVLRNFRGELRYMEPEEFGKYYDTYGG